MTSDVPCIHGLLDSDTSVTMTYGHIPEICPLLRQYAIVHLQFTCEYACVYLVNTLPTLTFWTGTVHHNIDKDVP